MTERRQDSHEFDENAVTNTSANGDINALIATRLSRRALLGSGVGVGAASLFTGLGLPAVAHSDAPTAPALGFTAVAKSTADLVSLPAGYSFRVLASVGDPLDDVQTPWAGDGSESPESYEHRFGDHHDGIAYFGLSGGLSGKTWAPGNSNTGLLVTNHEGITRIYLHQNSDGNASPRNGEQALKEMNAHGVSVAQVKKVFKRYYVLRKSTFNRRITALTPIRLAGPVAGKRFTVTRHDPGGYRCRGTLNNCANGVTPWGTYLTCEENWAGFFARSSTDNAARSSADVTLLNRYGITQGVACRHKWNTVNPAVTADTGDRFSRWNVSVTGSSTDGADDYRNEPNTFGWVVEIDPFRVHSLPAKRTALGRFAHEGAWFAPAVAGQPLTVYMGDDTAREYIYKYVSDALWDTADINGGMAAGDKYLDKGTLYVAKFNADGSGQWLALAFGQNGLDAGNSLFPFTSKSAVLVATRLAADAVGATKMDRPEWGGVNPLNGEVYMTLTNNSLRNGLQDAANPRAYDADTGSFASSQNGNVNGHVIRWHEAGGNHAALTFSWDIYLFGARAAYPANVNLSALDASNDLSSPDGLWFDPRGLLWILTDDGAYDHAISIDTTTSNCMMLAATPGSVGDGAYYDVPTATGSVRTYVGAAPGSNLRRFLVGPNDCEITGVCMAPDNKTLFVNIQHPGVTGSLPATVSNWPDSQTNPASSARPRSSTIAISRDDGGDIGVA